MEKITYALKWLQTELVSTWQFWILGATITRYAKSIKLKVNEVANDVLFDQWELGIFGGMNPEEYRISLLVRKKASLHSLIIYIKKRVYVKSYMTTKSSLEISRWV